MNGLSVLMVGHPLLILVSVILEILSGRDDRFPGLRWEDTDHGVQERLRRPAAE